MCINKNIQAGIILPFHQGAQLDKQAQVYLPQYSFLGKSYLYIVEIKYRLDLDTIQYDHNIISDRQKLNNTNKFFLSQENPGPSKTKGKSRSIPIARRRLKTNKKCIDYLGRHQDDKTIVIGFEFPSVQSYEM